MIKKTTKLNNGVYFKKLDPQKRAERRMIIKKAVGRTVREYGKALEKLKDE